MATERWQRVIEVFEAATERSPRERAAYVEAACAKDADLRREVESLLKHDAAANEAFLETAPPTPYRGTTATDSAADDRRVGTAVAGYRIIERIATGGMGTVYRARQAKLQRDVALKVVRPGLSAAGALRRLEHEAQYLARLRHPHIAQVFEAGTFADPATGATLPYFVMELVEGAQPITAYCLSQNPGRKSGADNAKSPAAPRTPRPPTGVGGSDGLSLRERLTLFLQVCDAVHHGHQRGLIHRDLKPGNFGVARSTDADITLTTLETDSRQLVGTLQYMSPEQCSADAVDLDVRSDVYALGVVLYELVCDQPPYNLAGTTIYSGVRIVCDQPAVPPRAVRPRIARDLEAILLKCLEKNKTHRYQSTAQLADDLRRHLAGEPVTARAPGRFRRLVRWISRHAIAATALACILMLGLTTLATAVGLYVAGQRPNKLFISDDGREVQLQTVAGRRTGPVLWSTTRESVCALSRLLDRKGRRLAILGLPRNDNGPIGAGLYAFDADKGLTAEGVRWRRLIQSENIPPPPHPRVFQPLNFHIRDVQLIDVFQENDGPELVGTWSHETYSWGSLCIYTLDGQLLYQIWHDGYLSVGHIQWLPDVGLLVLASSYCTHRPRIVADGLPPFVAAVPVVFAIRPRCGQIETKLISVPERDAWRALSEGRDTATGPRAAPEWYRFVWPLDRRYAIAPVRGYLTRWVWPPLASGTQAHVVIRLWDRDGADFNSVMWRIDASGVSVPDSLMVGDPYAQALAEPGSSLPPPSRFRLVDLDTLLADPFGEIAFGTALDQSE